MSPHAGGAPDLHLVGLAHQLGSAMPRTMTCLSSTRCRGCRGTGQWAGVRGIGLACEDCEGAGWIPAGAVDGESAAELAAGAATAVAYGQWLGSYLSAWDRFNEVAHG